MKIVKEYPPNIHEIKTALPIKDGDVFCYGDFIYNPSGNELPPDIIFHENIHKKQQENQQPAVWWTRYLEVKSFRAEKELEAYRGQYKFIKENYLAKAHKEALDELALNFSSMYGLGISFNQAKTLIRKL